MAPAKTLGKRRIGENQDNMVPSTLNETGQALEGHTDSVNCVLVLPESHLIVTACRDGHVRVYSPSGDGACLRAFKAHTGGVASLGQLGGDILVSGGYEDGCVSTWKASTGDALECFQLNERYRMVLKIVAVKAGCFLARVVTVESRGTLFVFSHESGRNVRILEELSLEMVNGGVVLDVSVSGDLIAVSAETKARSERHSNVVMLNASTLKPFFSMLAKLGKKVRGPSVAVGQKYIAIGSRDRIHLYQNTVGCPLVWQDDGIHLEGVELIKFVGDELLVSASESGIGCSCIFFTSLPTGESVRMDIPLSKIYSIAVTADGRLACAGFGIRQVLIVSPPAGWDGAIISSTLKAHAALIFAQPKAQIDFQQAPAPSGAADFATERQSSLEELKALSSKPDALEAMTVEALAEVVAGAMIGFHGEFRSRLPTLARCLRIVFRNNGVAGDMIVSFPQAKLLRNIVDTLHRDAVYMQLDEAAIDVFEWRLGRFLQDLRLKK